MKTKKKIIEILGRIGSEAAGKFSFNLISKFQVAKSYLTSTEDLIKLNKRKL
jgi:hypothetical protein